MDPQNDLKSHDFGELGARVYRLCLALLADDARARDATQEALMRAWSRRHRRRRGVSWWTWAAGFAVRICRETRRKPPPVALPVGLDLALASDTGELSEGDTERLTVVHRAIAELPDRQREVLVLRMLLGQSTAETASTLGCPEGTVKSNLHKAVGSLRVMVARVGNIDELRNV